MPESCAAMESWKVARIERPSVVLWINRCTARISAAEIATSISRDWVITTGPRNNGLLANGEITTAVTVRGVRVSAGARQKIEAAGGRVEE